MTSLLKTMMTAAIIGTILLTGNLVSAGDLDDGISTYKDESIEADGEIGKPDINISFIVLDAISSAKRNKDDDNVNISGDDSQSNQNSVVCEAGADCSGPIYNIDLD